MRQLALRSVLSAKVNDGQLKILDKLEFDKPSTKQMLDILIALGIDSSAIIATAEKDDNVVKSADNLPGVKTMPVRQLNVADLLANLGLIVTEAALRVAEETWGQRTIKATAKEAK